MTDELDFDTPRVSTARIIIFCLQCRKFGTVDRGRYRGPTMKLKDYLAGQPHVCSACRQER